MREIDPAGAHQPVLRDACLDLLAPALQVAKPVVIDCTLGMGGHTEAMLERFETLTVLGIDRDQEAIALASKRLSRFGDRFQAFHTTYDQVGEVAATVGGMVDGILMDLGVSSLQLDEVDRGFSYARDAALDMRMDQQAQTDAGTFLNTADEAELRRVLHLYGEEKFAGRIAKNIVKARAEKPLTRTSELVAIVRDSLPAAAMRTGGNPAKRTFQAIRIAVNDELGILRLALPRAINSLRLGGRLVVESYQSLEDRLVKRSFAAGATTQAPPDLPVVPESAKPYLQLVTKGARRATEAEIADNPRSAPVRLRACEKIRDVKVDDKQRMQA
ncbi:16S rRNA (cytosine(1402)-N(4))-methyltransferase [Boudabousia tangfeifanii]|uniref:Ribosomal RNA small subunit methyltransferase H n=1 Tax=Boudabousia tangfeifanii TaxID=1912795 RepID=A0A1D9MKH3_9ACTO|nr:16S rRNA (cytosine(1402)-N(4))-methyltransferase RsmH [Boudabousia tangfeifanii]AOZ72851.1 16S rRNA (cytosine(1402)-N(4))-methyltransferase [Boudabousia tangfeifanii]